MLYLQRSNCPNTGHNPFITTWRSGSNWCELHDFSVKSKVSVDHKNLQLQSSLTGAAGKGGRGLLETRTTSVLHCLQCACLQHCVCIDWSACLNVYCPMQYPGKGASLSIFVLVKNATFVAFVHRPSTTQAHLGLRDMSPKRGGD